MLDTFSCLDCEHVFRHDVFVSTITCPACHTVFNLVWVNCRSPTHVFSSLTRKKEGA